jgi:hypothetical protein
MPSRSALAALDPMPATTGRTAFAWGTARVLINVQPTGA